MLGIKIGIADGAQHDRRGNAADISSKAADVGGCRVVVHLVVALAEYPGLGVQDTGAGQVRVIRDDLGRCAGVAGRVETNAEITGGDGQAVAAAADLDGARRHAGAGAVVVSAKNHVAGGDRRGRAHCHIVTRSRGHVACDHSGCRRDGDIVDRRKGKHPCGRFGGGCDVDIMTGDGRDAAVDAGNGRVDVDIVHGVKGQGGGSGPGYRVIDVDITRRAGAARTTLQGDAG